MSKVAIKGAASGTATFTIESPATNTDRTLVLPDNAGTVITTATTTGLNASALSTGTVAPARLGSGTPDATNVLRGDGSWQVVEGVPAGSVMYFAANTAPTGFVKANGATISRTTFAALFAAIGTTYGAGNGSTTFGLPDLRGEFPRGWDDGRGVDSGRGFGSSQTDAFQNHGHSLQGQVGSQVTNVGATLAGSNTNLGGFRTISTVSALNLITNGGGTPRTASETRPRNIALLACIKF